MAQTEKDQSIIRVLLKDNTTMQVSQRDLRDALASMMGYAGICLSVGGAPAPINGVGTAFTIINIFDTITAKSIDVNTLGTDAVLNPDYKLILNSPGIYKVGFFASFSSSANNILVTFRTHVKGVPGMMEVDRSISSVGDTGVVSFSGIPLQYLAGDYIDMRVKIDAGTTNLTFLAAGLTVSRKG